MARYRKTLLAIVTLVTLVASVTLAFSTMSKNIRPSFAQAAGVTATDVYVPSGNADPWGTTFDSKGNVWVALPGCDPSPTCGSTTPPGKIAVFNPAHSAWTATYQLPAGYGQPLFLAF